MRSEVSAAVVLTGALLAAVSARAQPGTPAAFLQTYCVECHGAEKQKGERRFDTLALPVADLDGIIAVQDVIDQLNLGDMPPKKSPQPEASERREVVAALTAMVAEARRGLAATGGQGVLRRLNKREYLNTVGDLFALDMRLFDPTAKFPRDQTAEHFDNLGDVLQTSGYLLAQHLDAADAVVERALGMTQRPGEQSWVFNKNFQQQPELRYSHGKVYNFRYLCVYEGMNSTNHEGGYAPVHGFEQGVPHDGVYEIRVHAQALNRRHPYDPEIFGRKTEEPFRLGVVPGDVTAGPLHHPQPVEPLLAEVTVKDDDLAWYTLRVPLHAGMTPRFVFPNGMANCRRAFSQLASKYRNHWPPHERNARGIVEARRLVLQYGQMPHIRIHEVRVRGPIVEQWPPASQRALLGKEPFAAERMRDLLERFAARAYRRPVAKEEVDRLMRVAESRRAGGAEDWQAFKDGIKAALCSPAFLYHRGGQGENAEKLDAHALASRLSYFLWSAPPDEELRRLADSGDLLESSVLRAQTRRLLASPRAEAFAGGFLDAWLNLRSLGDMPPDRDAFERYYSRDMQAAMKTETRLFMRHLLEENLPATRFLDADFTFVNQALADLYELGRIAPPERAHEFQRVSLKDGRRGGLLGQGSVLTVSANGIETSPVTRGVWLLENLLGTPPAPPPDNVPPIDPDIRGATSMREILTKHRDNPGCFDCHQKIDPLGFALENFDPIGAWREHYGDGKKRGPRIDASGELPDGSRFADVTELKKVLLARKESFARMLTEKLLAYACGRRMETLDRPEVDRIVADLKSRDYPLRDLVESVVSSALFARP